MPTPTDPYTDSLGRTLKDLDLLPYPKYTTEELAILHKILREEITVPGTHGLFHIYDPTIFDNQENFEKYLNKPIRGFRLLLHAPFKDLPTEIVERKTSFGNAMYRSILKWRLQLGV